MMVLAGNVTLQCVVGDIAAQPDIDAVVNASNSLLSTGGGVAGAIHEAAGPGLYEECIPLAPISPGQAVITGGHRLPNRYVIHCLGPKYGTDEPSDKLLADCYKTALGLAEKKSVESIAFPAIAAGVFGFPLPAATEVALGTVLRMAPSLQSVQLVRFVLFSKATLAVYEDTLERLLS